MTHYKFGVVAGDGVGPEVVRAALGVLARAADLYGFTYEAIEYPWCAEHYLATGVTMPDGIFDEYRTLDSILLGAIGDPRLEVGFLERAIVAGLRFKLDLYVNLRPVTLYADHLCPLRGKGPDQVNLICVRENTEGVYAGIGGYLRVGTSEEVAVNEMIYTRRGTERIIRYAFELARTRPRKKLTLVDKANAIRAQDIYTRVFAQVGEEYPDVERDHAYIDAACMWLVKNPEAFDVVVTNNMFGDIFSDLGAAIQGGLGLAAGGNIHPGQVSVFEPIHGSAPKYAGQNVACPLATIESLAMMLDHVGESTAAGAVHEAVRRSIVSKRIPDLSARSGIGTDRQGEIVTEELEAFHQGA